MARKQVEGQELLIENDTPEIKAVKRQIKEYDKLRTTNRETGAANRDAEEKKRAKVFESVKLAGIDPDTEGVYHIEIDETDWAFSQDSQLKIKKHKIKGDDAGDGDDGDDD